MSYHITQPKYFKVFGEASWQAVPGMSRRVRMFIGTDDTEAEAPAETMLLCSDFMNACWINGWGERVDNTDCPIVEARVMKTTIRTENDSWRAKITWYEPHMIFTATTV